MAEVEADEKKLGRALRNNEAVVRFMRDLEAKANPSSAPRVLLPMRVKTERRGRHPPCYGCLLCRIGSSQIKIQL